MQANTSTRHVYFKLFL